MRCILRILLNSPSHLFRPLDADDISFAEPNGRMFHVCTPGET